MSSEEARYVSPMEVTPTLGEGTLDTWRFRHQRGGRTQSRRSADVCGGARLWVNHGYRGVCEPALKPRRTMGRPHGRKAKVSNRTREIRPSGIIGGPRET